MAQEHSASSTTGMKVCIFTYTECRGTADSRVLKEAATLKQAGYDVRIVAWQGEETCSYEDRNGVRILRISLITKRIGLLLRKHLPKKSATEVQETESSVVQNHDEKNLEKAKRNPTRNVPNRAIILAGNLLRRIYPRLLYSYFSYIDYYWRSFWLIRQEPAEVYHAHDLMTLPVAWLLKIATKGKVLYDSHELWLDRNRYVKRSRLNKFLIRKLESFLIRRSDVTITVSESIARALAERYRVVQPTVIVNAPDYHPVERSNLLRDEIKIPTEDKVVLYIGAITFNRGLEELIESLKYLKGCSLVLMGYGEADYIYGLKRLITNEALSDRVYLFGPVPYAEVTRYAASADLGVAPIKNVCLSYYYCSPNKVFECLAAGLPVVGSNFPELKRVIEDHKVGVTFDPESPHDIARAIDYVLADRNRYEEMRRNTLEAARIYNWQNESLKLIALYGNIVGYKRG